MESNNALMRVGENPAIDQVAQPFSKAVRGAFEAAGPVGQQAKNALHGVWLGHPLHPVFTESHGNDAVCDRICSTAKRL